jgi:hypothetical protein
MARYSREDVSRELKELESKIMAKAESFLRAGKYKDVASLLFSIDNEIYQTEREARKLRLMGRLDYEVYRSLIDGYVELQRQIIELSGGRVGKAEAFA